MTSKRNTYFPTVKIKFKLVVSPKNIKKKREPNFHSKHTNNYETTLGFIENSNLSNKNTEACPIFKKLKSVLNDFFEVPLETKINNPKFKIGSICLDVLEIPKQDLKSKLKATRFELMKKPSPSPRKYFEKGFNLSHQFKEFNLVIQKDDEDIIDKLKFRSERSSKFASTNGTTVKSETHSTYFSPKRSNFSLSNKTILKTENDNKYISPKRSSFNTSFLMVSKSNTCNKYVTASDWKLFALINNSNVNESLGLRVKNYSTSNINKTKVNMSK